MRKRTPSRIQQERNENEHGGKGRPRRLTPAPPDSRMFAALTTGEKKRKTGDRRSLRFRPGKLITEYINSASGELIRQVPTPDDSDK